MSKIFDAYRKRVGESPDLVQIRKPNAIRLFPPVAGKQREEFSRLVAKLIVMRQENRGAVVSMASSSSGEGTSYVSYNTAAMLADDYSLNVAWIDANFNSPQQKLESYPGPSLLELLKDPDILHTVSLESGLTVIKGGGNLVASRGLFADDRYEELLAGLAAKFDFTILDLPPVLDSTDTALMASKTDGMLLVIEHRFLKREIIQHGLEELQDKGVRVLGSVINRRTFELPKFIYDRI